MNKCLLFLLCLVSLSATSQDLTGIWRGHFRQGGSQGVIQHFFGEGDRYKFEVQLNQQAKRFKGVTYSYKTTVFYGKATCSGSVNPSTKKVLLEELKIVEVRMIGGSACIMTLFLQYSKSGEEEFLEGDYSSYNVDDSSDCGKGTVFLRKVETSDFYKEPFLVELEKKKAAAKKAPVTAGSSSKPPATKINPATTTKPASPTNRPKTTTPSTAAKKPATTSTAKKTTSPATKSSTTTAKKPVTSSTDKKTTTNPATKSPTNTAKSTPGQKANPSPRTDDKAASPSKSNPTVKVTRVDTTARIEKKVIVTPKVLLTRENELVKTITTNANEITINLYDNGSIDNDTVSVYLDKKLVVARKRLTEKPITIKFPLDANNMHHELVMVAENLGEIPPNTSLMVVKAGTKQYDVRITSNEQKNAVIIFKYEKE